MEGNCWLERRIFVGLGCIEFDIQLGIVLGHNGVPCLANKFCLVESIRPLMASKFCLVESIRPLMASKS